MDGLESKTLSPNEDPQTLLNLLPKEKRERFQSRLTTASQMWARAGFWEDPERFIFSGFVMTHDPSHKPTTRAFPDLPYLHALVRTIHENDRLMVEKSRQMMFTNTMCAYMYWLAGTTEGGMIFVRSIQHNQAVSVLDRVRFLHDHLPVWLKGRMSKPMERQHRFTMEFENGAVITALAAGAKRIRMYTPTMVFDDECAQWEDYDEALAAALPGLESGGKYVAGSSAYPGDFEACINDRI